VVRKRGVRQNGCETPVDRYRWVMSRPGKALAVLCAVAVAGVGCGQRQEPPTAGPSAATTAPTPSPGGPGGLFSTAEPWTTDVSSLGKADRSDAVIAALGAMGGWGNGNTLQTDFSIPIFFADRNTPRVQVVGAEDYCFGGGPDCDAVPAQVPVPADANIEGSSDLTCDVESNDCHLLVVDREEQKLYEIYQGNWSGENITATGLFVWDLSKQYPQTLRGDQCTSADAAGFPIAAMTPTADEVASGTIGHALRFILPNGRMKAGVYVRPATHAGGPESDDPNAPPYGVRFRLRADFDDSGYSESARVVITALKTYGMMLADGGEIALTFADDRASAKKWSELGIDAQSFSSITVDQFEVVELGDEVAVTYECVRN